MYCILLFQGFTSYHLSCDHEKRSAAYFWGVLERSLPLHLKAEIKGLRMCKDMKVQCVFGYDIRREVVNCVFKNLVL